MTECPYAQLERVFERLSYLSGATGVLHWDRAVTMPPRGNEARAGQLATLAGLAHEMLTAPRVGELLGSAEEQAGNLDDWQRANLRLMRHEYLHATAVPGDLIEASARAAARAEARWREARPASDLEGLLPLWREVVGLAREAATAKAERLDLEPYDALLDTYDPGLRTQQVDRIFAALEGELSDLLPAIMDRQRSEGAPPPLPAPSAVQEKLGRELMERAGFDFRGGRLDVSTHPFTGGVPDDVRVTTRWDESDALTGLMAVLHETGHALYASGLPPSWRHQPVGSDAGMTAHESQSLIIEMQAARSRDFAQWLAGRMVDVFDLPADVWTGEALHRRMIRVEPGFIRVDADEVTYPLHIVLRYRLERRIIDGTLDLSDLDEAWNHGMRDLLGVDVPDARRGCLQDIHWIEGAFGYFPTYTLGALAAAQIFRAARQSEPEIEPALARGEFAPLVEWLRRHVHSRGALLQTSELLREATGEALGTDAFTAHIRQRYLNE